jgi:GNAT superfamily N-acetyltransferase
MLLRPASPADAPAIAKLLGELGYPATTPEVVDRLERLAAVSYATTLVVEVQGRVAGVVTGHVFPSLHANAIAAWITTLVVSSAYQSRGIGRTLTVAVEDWARRAGATRISVTSGMHRDGAHAFYEHVGYERSGLRLTKRFK